jgi:hypothetical protein
MAGMARHVLVRQGAVWQARHGLDGHGADGHGLAGMARHGLEATGLDRQAWLG